MTPSWKCTRVDQLAARSPNVPGVKAPVVIRPRGDFPEAMSSQTIGTAKKTTKKTATTRTVARPSHAPGVICWRRRVLVAFKESPSDDEEHAQRQRDDEQDDRDGRGTVEILLAEREEVRELVERVVDRDHALCRLGE